MNASAVKQGWIHYAYKLINVQINVMNPSNSIVFFPFLRRFLDMEVQRKVMVLQQRVKELENENSVLRQRISDTLGGKVK